MNNQKEKPHQKPIKKYLIFSGIAMEMIVTIGVGAWLGNLADEYYGNEKPILTLILMLVAVGISMLILMKRVKNL